MNQYEKRIAELLQKSYEQLNHGERLELIYYRFNKHEKISYEEFVLMCLANYEFEFEYKGITYEIINGLKGKGKSFFFDSKYENGKWIYDKEGKYASADELIKNVRIDGKTLKEIWKEVIL